MESKKLISKYQGRVNNFQKKAQFYYLSLEKNEADGRVQVSMELKHIINKLEGKIRIYKTVIEDLKQTI